MSKEIIKIQGFFLLLLRDNFFKSACDNTTLYLKEKVSIKHFFYLEKIYLPIFKMNARLAPYCFFTPPPPFEINT